MISIDAYFDGVQDYISGVIGLEHDIDAIVDRLKDDNIQSVINKGYHNGISIEDAGDEVISMMDGDKIEDSIPDALSGDRSMNKMESMIITKFDIFVNVRG